MSEHPRLDRPTVPVTDWLEPGPDADVRTRTSAWTGWLAFAGVLMVMTGALNATKGLANVLADEFYVVAPAQVLTLDFTAWGWLHIAVGGLVALTGAALLTGARWARPVTVVVVVITAVAQVAWVTVYPVWSAVVITLCVVVIWAVVRHGDTAGDR
ncbi:DUF7144 family membrane protein [Actinophytocola sp. KF-1]